MTKRTIFILLLVALLAILVITATASASSCYSIRDYDRQQACLAKERQGPEGCTSIRDWDDRERCRQRAGQRDLFGSSARDRTWPR